MKLLLRSCLISLSLVWAVPLFAMDFLQQGEHLFISGPVMGNEIGNFQAMLDDNPGIKTVVFVNSQGGNLLAGMTLGRMIASKGLNTVAVGACVSSCSVMFMGGIERRFSNAWRAAGTYIGIHGPAATGTGELMPMSAPQMYAFYKLRIGEKFNADLINTALYDMKNRGSLLYAFDPIRNKKELLYHCVSSETLRAQCTHYKDQDAFSMGIITHKELYTLELPQSLKPAPLLYGRSFADLNLEAMTNSFARIKDAQCTSTHCTSRIGNFNAADWHKGVAMALSGNGFGLSENRPSFVSAAHFALYQCNHLPTVKRLCQIEYVDGYQTSGLYTEAREKSQEILSNLRALPQKSYENEAQGIGIASQLKQGLPNEVTPIEVKGAKTILTGDLVLALQQAEKPLLIDVANDNQTLPGAHSLLFGGTVLSDAKRDAELENRFQTMLALIAPNKTAPIVFYCVSPQCWLSVNAVLRAVKIGYSQVYWYRGGLQAWRAASLSTVQAAPQAIVN